jgi:hypothetical protein
VSSRPLGVLGLMVVSALGCSSGPTVPGSPTPSPLPTVAPASPSPNPLSAGHYDDGVLAFDFPGEWNADRSVYPSSVSELKTYLSTGKLHAPCIKSGTANICSPPIESLSPGGVLVSWWRWGLHRGEPGPDPTAGELIHVGGRSARLHDSGAEGHCLGIESDTNLRLEIPDPTLDGSWTVMDACMRTPIEDPRAKIDAMLASVTWSAPQPTQVVPLSVASNNYSVQVFDDTALVTTVAAGMGTDVDAPTAIVNGSDLEISWYSAGCDLDPIVGLSQDAGRLLILLEPDANGDSAGACYDVLVPIRVVLRLSERVSQDDISLEVW